MKTSMILRRWLQPAILALSAGALTLQLQAQVLTTDTFGSGANTFTVDFVAVGNPGNVADNTTSYGAVPYAYRMGKYEVSRDMITKANSAGSLGITMFDYAGAGIGDNGPNRPATGVIWYEAAAFVNWLNTSTGHQPAYNLSGASLNLWPSGDAWQSGGENLYRHKDAHYFLPSENEWYKAAYYDGTLGVYYDYPTGSDGVPTAVAGGTTAGTAVYDQDLNQQGPADVANAGGLSPYGTMGQGGNVYEWAESAWDGVNDSGSEDRVVRGGFWNSAATNEGLEASDRGNGIDPARDEFLQGFRVAAVPEPLESAGVIGVAALGFALWRRRGSR